MLNVNNKLQIILFFLGPDALTRALPHGGQFIDVYPADLDNYMDGLIKRHWISHKAEGCKLTDPLEVAKLVSFFYLLFLLKVTYRQKLQRYLVWLWEFMRS
jgi:hypothetical protein